VLGIGIRDAGAVRIVNSTVHGNYVGIAVDSGGAVAAPLTSLTISNTLVTKNGVGVRDKTTGQHTASVVVQSSDVWGNTVQYENVVAGVGCIAEDPAYVAAPIDLRLTEGSPCVDVGNSSLAPLTDFVGAPRPFDGDDDGEAKVRPRCVRAHECDCCRRRGRSWR